MGWGGKTFDKQQHMSDHSYVSVKQKICIVYYTCAICASKEKKIMTWVLTATVAGSAGKPVNVNYQMTAADYTTAATDRTAILAALNAVTAGTILKHRLSEVTDVTSVLPEDVDMAIKGTLSGKINGTNKPVVVSFPAPEDSLRLETTGDGYNELDLSDTNGYIAAYWALFGVAGEATISDGENTGTLLRSQIVSVASRNP